jgi:hypothetical protein
MASYPEAAIYEESTYGCPKPFVVRLKFQLIDIRHSIFRTLCDAIDQLIQEDKIEPTMGPKILKHFMPSFKKTFAENLKETATLKVLFPLITSFDLHLSFFRFDLRVLTPSLHCPQTRRFPTILRVFEPHDHLPSPFFAKSPPHAFSPIRISPCINSDHS